MSVADEIRKLADLRQEGLLTEAEFEAQKTAMLDAPGAELGGGNRAGTGGVVLKTVLACGAVAVVAFLALGAYVSNSEANSDKHQLRAAINICWEEYKSSRLPLDSRRLIANSCDLLESDFMRQYGWKP